MAQKPSARRFYPQPSTPGLPEGGSFYAYSLDTAKLMAFSDANMTRIGVTLVNIDGSLLLFYAGKASGTVPEGFSLYQPKTGKYVSLNRALNSCEEKDESGNPIDESSCQYTRVPISIGDLAQAFTASGSYLTMTC